MNRNTRTNHNSVTLFSIEILIAFSIIVFIGLYDKSEPAPLLEQNIQAIQCMQSDGDLETYHIHIPTDVSNTARFIEGFCQSI